MPEAIVMFNAVKKRSDELIGLHENHSTTHPTGPVVLNEPGDLLRSALVLSVAAMDAYFTDKFINIFAPYIKKHGASKNLITFLDESGFNTEKALKMLTVQKPYWILRSVVESRLSKVTTQTADSIDKLFLCYGLKNFCKNVQGKAQRKNLLRRIEIAVERRHAIVHEGDLNSHGKLKKIVANEISGYIKDIALFVGSAESLLANISL